MMIMAAAAICAAFTMTSCKSSKNALEVSALNGEWNVTTVNGQKPEAEREVFIGMDLNKKNVYGCAGCNRIMGSIETDETKPGKLSFSKLGTTRMMCPDMDTESAVINAMKEVTAYKGTAEAIELTNKHGKTLLSLEKRTAAHIDALKGDWLITAVNQKSITELGKTEKAPFLSFNIAEMHVHGYGGCNVINGGIKQEKDNPTSLTFTQMISTMMAGPGLDVERQVLNALNSVRSFKKTAVDKVELLDENGQTVITLEPQTKTSNEK